MTRLHAVVQRTEEFRGKTQLGLRFVYLGERERLALRSVRLANGRRRADSLTDVQPRLDCRGTVSSSV